MNIFSSQCMVWGNTVLKYRIDLTRKKDMLEYLLRMSSIFCLQNQLESKLAKSTLRGRENLQDVMNVYYMIYNKSW